MESGNPYDRPRTYCNPYTVGKDYWDDRAEENPYVTDETSEPEELESNQSSSETFSEMSGSYENDCQIAKATHTDHEADTGIVPMAENNAYEMVTFPSDQEKSKKPQMPTKQSSKKSLTKFQIAVLGALILSFALTMIVTGIMLQKEQEIVGKHEKLEGEYDRNKDSIELQLTVIDGAIRNTGQRLNESLILSDKREIRLKETEKSLEVVKPQLHHLKKEQSEINRNLTKRIGEVAASIKFAPDGSTCHEIFQSGKAGASGVYTLGAGTGTFTAYCNLVEGKVITEFWHDGMGEIQSPSNLNCESPGCYSWTPNYRINSNYILSVIQKSRECRQFIRAKCINQMFLPRSYAYWVSRDGERMNYWGGATSERDGYCACGETGTCVRSDLKCNCDVNNGTTVVDEGYLTNKIKLPVRELRFGDFSDATELVWHKLGKLECWGEA